MKAQSYIHLALMILCLLAIHTGAPAQSVDLSRLPDQDKTLFAEKFLQLNFPEDQDDLPQIKIGKQYIREQELGILGEYDARENAIYLHPDAFRNLGTLESTLVHEMYHFRVQQLGSGELAKRREAARKKIREHFDIDAIADQLGRHGLTPEDVVDMIAGIIEQPLEEVLVSEMTLRFDNYQDTDHARAAGERSLRIYQEALESFWREPKELYLGGEKETVSPRQDGPREQHTEYPGDTGLPDFTGNFACTDCDSPHNKPGTYTYPIGAGATMTLIISPTIIQKRGDHITLFSQHTTKSTGYQDGTHLHGPIHSVLTTTGAGTLHGNEVILTTTNTPDAIQKYTITRIKPYSGDPKIRKIEMDTDRAMQAMWARIKSVAEQPTHNPAVSIVFLSADKFRMTLLEGEFKGRTFIYERIP